MTGPGYDQSSDDVRRDFQKMAEAAQQAAITWMRRPHARPARVPAAHPSAELAARWAIADAARRHAPHYAMRMDARVQQHGYSVPPAAAHAIAAAEARARAAELHARDVQQHAQALRAAAATPGSSTTAAAATASALTMAYLAHTAHDLGYTSPTAGQTNHVLTHAAEEAAARDVPTQTTHTTGHADQAANPSITDGANTASVTSTARQADIIAAAHPRNIHDMLETAPATPVTGNITAPEPQQQHQLAPGIAHQPE